MGPNSNPELFNVVAPDALQVNLADEIERRLLLAGVLSELSAAFEAGDGSDHEVTDPTLAYKLVALAAVQNTEMGVAGSNPIDALQIKRSTLTVRAQAAPPHDAYHSSVANATVATRAIRIKLGGDNRPPGLFGMEAASTSEKPTVEFFGLNMYVPDMLDADPDSVLDPSAIPPQPAAKSISSGLVIVDPSGKAKSAESYISGETAIIAVRNSQTGDAKVYAVTPIDRTEAEATIEDFSKLRFLDSGQPVMHEGAAYVALPNGRAQCIRVLSGAERRAAAAEFASATEVSKANAVVLSEEERRAARSPHS